jgi:hypothetical protein
MKTYPHDLLVDKFNSHYSENEFYNKYLKNSSLRGFYFDCDDRSCGIVMQFLEGNDKISIHAIESVGNYPVTDYLIIASSLLIECVAYDRVLLSTSRYRIENISTQSNSIKIPSTLEFTLQMMTRNALFIRFINSEQYDAPIRSLKGGLVLSREADGSSQLQFDDQLLKDAV